MIDLNRHGRSPAPFLLVAPLAALLIGAANSQVQYVRDDAGMLSPQTIAAIEAKDRQLAATSGKYVQVVTEATTNGTPVTQAAADTARQLGVNGAIIYVAKDDRKFAVAYGRYTQAAFSPATQTAIKDDMSAAFRSGDFDGGISGAVNAIADRMQSLPAAVGNRPQPAALPAAAGGAQAPAADSGQGAGGIPLIWWIIGLGALFLILRSFARRSAAPMAGPMAGGPGRYPTPSTGYGGGFGGGGGFMSGLLGGAVGGFLGNELAGGMRGPGQGAIDPAAAAPDPGSGWTGNDAGGGFMDSGGGGDFGGGDVGGGGDSGGSW
ncbi:MAG: TPM domain-containing protein [Candidatus Eremiobacteraeota bacterium]|nr:TPM domain-containing protein [Candidatus Eremiobacteraeota bacterium]